ncbi:hypothetical protein [Persephonella sp.]
MKTYEFLKEIYEDAKSTYEYMRAENYRLSFEKFRNFLWVNLALFTAGLFFIKFVGKSPIEIYIFMGFNFLTSLILLYKIAEARNMKTFSKFKKARDIGYDKSIDWFYEEIANEDRREEKFYISLIKEKESLIFDEVQRVKSNIVYYIIIGILIFIEGAFLFFTFIKYTGGG